MSHDVISQLARRLQLARAYVSAVNLCPRSLAASPEKRQSISTHSDIHSHSTQQQPPPPPPPHPPHPPRPPWTASEQREFQAVVEKRQMKEFMAMYSNLVQRCFDDCINDFTSKTVTSKEEGCISKCVDKWLKGSERMGQRFAEQNAAMMQGGGPLAGTR
ncbi:hypothetical protein Dda_7746 [Drechslerella dactyloides]|uniref:Mitochondrial import inner membrane translocase subunit TIM9 n=1 Tax=Drechslerella dactyloides TaxID=74499 RepID=A0AAD6IWD3_DREDA|nr:hypothetical protein Dda_7746 [Drechslerella dactyloides]